MKEIARYPKPSTLHIILTRTTWKNITDHIIDRVLFHEGKKFRLVAFKISILQLFKLQMYVFASIPGSR